MAALDNQTQLGIFAAIVVVVIILTCGSIKGKCLPWKSDKSDKSDKTTKAVIGKDDKYSISLPGCYAAGYCQPSMEAFYPHNRYKKNPYEMPRHDRGHDIFGYGLNSDYCRYGLGQEGIVDGENDLWRFQIYTVQPSMVNLKFQKVHM